MRRLAHEAAWSLGLSNGYGCQIDAVRAGDRLGSCSFQSVQQFCQIWMALRSLVLTFTAKLGS